MIKLNNIYRSYDDGKTYILQNLTFEIKQGQFISILGESGVGKTTLLNILSTMDTFDKGEYLFGDVNMQKLTDYEVAKFRNKKIGVVFQNYNLIPTLNVFDNIKLPLLFNEEYEGDYEEDIRGVLKKLKIEKLIDKKVTELSGGEIQRVSIARALINKPDIILADEPTGNLDNGNTKRLISILKQLNQEGQTIILVTHDHVLLEDIPIKFLLERNKLVRLK